MVKVFYSKNGQVKVTIPKAIAEAMQLQHKQVISFIFNGRTWEIKSKGKMVKVFYSSNGQVKVTIPKVIAEAMQLSHGQEVKFIFNGKTWELKIVKKSKQ